MEKLKTIFKEKAEKLSQEIKDILKEHGTKKIGEVELSQIYQGMRGITGMVYETSLLDAHEGIRFRGYSIPELYEKLPKAKDGNEPLPEGLFWLLLTNEIPTKEDVEALSKELFNRAKIPAHVYQTIDALPVHTHPMTQFVSGIMAMQTESIFAKKYAEGMSKKDYWHYMYEDALNLISALPFIASYIYRRKYKSLQKIEAQPFKVDSKNKIGCGDIFGATFFYHFLQTNDLQISIQKANKAGAIAASIQNLSTLKRLPL